jgi:hypothetical protein
VYVGQCCIVRFFLVYFFFFFLKRNKNSLSSRFLSSWPTCSCFRSLSLF